MSYGPDLRDLLRRAGGYKAAKALGIEMPAALIARADKVIK